MLLNATKAAVEEGIVAGGGVALVNTIPAVAAYVDTLVRRRKDGRGHHPEGAGRTGSPDRGKRRPGRQRRCCGS